MTEEYKVQDLRTPPKYKYFSLLATILLLAGCQDVIGPANVPEYSVYGYQSKTPSCNNPLWRATGGIIVGGSRTRFARVKWNAGPAVGVVTLSCDGSNYSKDVNIIAVTITNARIQTGTVIDGGEHNGFRIASSGGPPATNAGAYMSADVAVRGPNGNQGINEIRVGFYQRLTAIPIWEASYGEQGQKLKAELNPNDILPLNDYSTGGGPAWYHPISPGIFNPTRSQPSGSILMRDSPSTRWPAQHTTSHLPLTVAAAQYNFDNFICTWSRDNPNVYTIRAFKSWTFRAAFLNNSVGGDLTPTRLPGNNFTIVTNGNRCEPTGGNTALSAVQRITWVDAP